MRQLLRFGSLGLAATLVISACATPTPSTGPSLPSDEPALNEPLAPSAGAALAEDAAPEFPADVKPLLTAPTAPQPPITVRNHSLFLPTGGSVSLDNLYQDLPASIPQDEASQWLGPMPGAIPQGFGQIPTGAPGLLGPGGFGAFPGVVPDLLTYDALARCLYFPYKSFWIPYYLVGGAYYPYSYSPFYDDALSGCFAYPLFYGSGDYCYPYTFLSSSYRFGYPDWEYYWPAYRKRFSHRRFQDDFDSYRRRWSPRQFQGWLSERRKDRSQENWRERFRSVRHDRPDRDRGPRGDGRGDRDRGSDRGNRGDSRGDRDRGSDRDHRVPGNRPDVSRPDRNERPQRVERDRSEGRQARPGKERGEWRESGGSREGTKPHARQGGQGGQGERVSRDGERSGSSEKRGGRRGGKD